jgi:hypothetical protein
MTVKEFVKALGDYPELLPWQEDVLTKFQGGIKAGEMLVMTAGRQTGKSVYNQAMQRMMDDLVDRPIEELRCSTGTVFGKRYLTVEPVGGNWIAMEKWCSDAFGAASSIWDTMKADGEPGRWYMNDRKFWFLDEKDRTMFLLKWR